MDIGRRIDTFLGEFRIFVPALAVVFGFQLQAAFSTAWDDLGTVLRLLNFLALSATALAILFFLMPASYHRLTSGLDESEWFLHFAQRSVGIGLGFMTASLVLSLHLQAVRAFDLDALAPAAGAGFLLLFLVAWWAIPHWLAHRRGIHHAGHAP